MTDHVLLSEHLACLARLEPHLRTTNPPTILPFDNATMNLDLNSLKEAAANLSLYDLKAGVRKVQNGKLSQNMQPLNKLIVNSCHELH